MSTISKRLGSALTSASAVEFQLSFGQLQRTRIFCRATLSDLREVISRERIGCQQGHALVAFGGFEFGVVAQP